MRLLHGNFSCSLGSTVGRCGGDFLALAVPAALTGKHCIGGYVDEGCASGSRLSSKNSAGSSVHGEGQLRVFFAQPMVGQGCAMQNDIRFHHVHRIAHSVSNQ